MDLNHVLYWVIAVIVKYSYHKIFLIVELIFKIILLEGNIHMWKEGRKLKSNRWERERIITKSLFNFPSCFIGLNSDLSMYILAIFTSHHCQKWYWGKVLPFLLQQTIYEQRKNEKLTQYGRGLRRRRLVYQGWIGQYWFYWYPLHSITMYQVERNVFSYQTIEF